MELQEIKDTIDNLFDRLDNPAPHDDKERIIDDFSLRKHLIDRVRYPLLGYTILRKEITELIENGVLDNGYRFSSKLLNNGNSMSALEKIMYSILWKNGDLGKERFVIAGIMNYSLETASEGIVFTQFGRHLADRSEPIIDQNTIRCFLIREEMDVKRIKDYLCPIVVGGKLAEVAKRYTLWIKEPKNRKLKGYEIDEVLFAMGRKIRKR